MISRFVKIQLVVFALITVVGVAYTGLNYVGFSFATKPMTVTAVLPSSGGIFTNAEVTYDGVHIGRVGGLTLRPNGVAAKLLIDDGYRNRIPADAKVVVANLSAVGEQYIDLQPQTNNPPFLHNGSELSVDRATLPLDDASLLLNLDKLVNSVDRTQLGVVIQELGKSFDGSGPDLQRLIDQGNLIVTAATNDLPTTLKLVDDGKVVLDTQRAVSGDLRTFAANLASLSGQLVTSDPDLRKLLDNGVQSAQVLDKLLQDNRGDLQPLLANLLTLGQIQAARLPGLEQLLVLYPLNVANGFLAARGGVAHFGLVSTSSPPACTQGYESTTKRGNSGTGADAGGPANLNTYCAQPPQGPSDVRGGANAPRPAGDTTAGPPGAVGTGGGGAKGAALAPTSADAAPVVTPWDPASGMFAGPSGQTYQLGSTGGQFARVGSASWEWMLVSPAVS